MDEQVNPLEREHSICVVLPGGLEKNATVHGSKPVMDLLVTLCASYHLNPSDYTVEILSPNKNIIGFKPNSPVGLLEAEKIVLKPKLVEEKIRRPYMPEATVRLLINYNKFHKTVVRVNPKLPLELLLPVVCDKCEFKVETTVLLRDSQSKELLDLTKTLNEHGLREVFAKDTASKDSADIQHQPKAAEEAAVSPAEVISLPPLQDLPKKAKKQKNRGFLSLFRRRKKKTEANGDVTAPMSPGLSKQAGVGMNSMSVSSSNTLPTDMPKKRRAPQPPVGASQSVPNNLSSCHLAGTQRSAESTLRSTKRRAPPPPCTNPLKELQADSDVRETTESLKTLEQLRESDESDSVNLSLSSPSSPHPSQPLSSSSHSSWADPYLPSFRGKDLSDARSALAKVLMSSVSKGTLVQRLKNSSTFSKLHNSSSLVSMTPKCSGNGVSSSEFGSILKSNLPTENEWEDPVQRRGLTTFKVVPPTNLKPPDPEVIPDVPDQCQKSTKDNSESDASPEVRNPQTELEEDPCAPNREENETTLSSPETSHEIPASPPPLEDSDDQNCSLVLPSEVEDTAEKQEEPWATSEEIPAELTGGCEGEFSSKVDISSEDLREVIQPSSTDVELCSSCAEEKKAEDVVVQEEEEASFPPPPPPVFFNDNVDIIEEQKEDTGSTFSKPPSPTINGQSEVSTETSEDESISAIPSPSPDSTAPSRFAQAVAMAVQSSHLQSRGKGSGPQAANGPHSALPSPPRSTYQYGA